MGKTTYRPIERPSPIRSIQKNTSISTQNQGIYFDRFWVDRELGIPRSLVSQQAANSSADGHHQPHRHTTTHQRRYTNNHGFLTSIKPRSTASALCYLWFDICPERMQLMCTSLALGTYHLLQAALPSLSISLQSAVTTQSNATTISVWHSFQNRVMTARFRGSIYVHIPSSSINSHAI